VSWASSSEFPSEQTASELRRTETSRQKSCAPPSTLATVCVALWLLCRAEEQLLSSRPPPTRREDSSRRSASPKRPTPISLTSSDELRPNLGRNLGRVRGRSANLGLSQALSVERPRRLRASRSRGASGGAMDLAKGQPKARRARPSGRIVRAFGAL